MGTEALFSMIINIIINKGRSHLINGEGKATTGVQVDCGVRHLTVVFECMGC